jgi:hypothetical protein
MSKKQSLVEAFNVLKKSMDFQHQLHWFSENEHFLNALKAIDQGYKTCQKEKLDYNSNKAMSILKTNLFGIEWGEQVNEYTFKHDTLKNLTSLSDCQIKANTVYLALDNGSLHYKIKSTPDGKVQTASFELSKIKAENLAETNLANFHEAILEHIEKSHHIMKITPFEMWNITIKEPGNGHEDSFQYQFVSPPPDCHRIFFHHNKDGKVIFDIKKSVDMKPDLDSVESYDLKQQYLGCDEDINMNTMLEKTGFTLKSTIEALNEQNIQRIGILGFARNHPEHIEDNQIKYLASKLDLLKNKLLAQQKASYATRAINELIDELENADVKFTTVGGGWAGQKKGYDIAWMNEDEQNKTFHGSKTKLPKKNVVYVGTTLSGKHLKYTVLSANGEKKTGIIKKETFQRIVGINNIPLKPAKENIHEFKQLILKTAQDNKHIIECDRESGLTYMGHLYGTVHYNQKGKGIIPPLAVMPSGGSSDSVISQMSAQIIWTEPKVQHETFIDNKKGKTRKPKKNTIYIGDDGNGGFTCTFLTKSGAVQQITMKENELISQKENTQQKPTKENIIAFKDIIFSKTIKKDSVLANNGVDLAMATQFIVPNCEWGEDSPYLASLCTSMVVLEPAGRWTQIEMLNGLERGIPVAVIASPQNYSEKWIEGNKISSGYEGLAKGERFVEIAFPTSSNKHETIRVYRSPKDTANWIQWRYIVDNMTNAMTIKNKDVQNTLRKNMESFSSSDEKLPPQKILDCLFKDIKITSEINDLKSEILNHKQNCNGQDILTRVKELLNPDTAKHTPQKASIFTADSIFFRRGTQSMKLGALKPEYIQTENILSW